MTAACFNGVPKSPKDHPLQGAAFNVSWKMAGASGHCSIHFDERAIAAQVASGQMLQDFLA
jgi:hypothetical protein